MSKIRLLSVIVALIALSSVMHAQYSRLTAGKSLPQAISDGDVFFQFQSNGASSGDSILLTITSLRNTELLISILPGTRLTNVSGTGQSMVIAGVRGVMQGPNAFTPTSQIDLKDNNAHVYLLSAYCAEFAKDNPSPNSVFSLGLVDQTLDCILAASVEQGLSIQATQASVWIYTDRISPDVINHKFSITPADWSAAMNVFQRCTSSSLGQPQYGFTPQQLSMRPGGQPFAQENAARPTMQEKSFNAWDPGYGSGVLYISADSVRFVGQDKHGNPIPKYTWATSCDQIVKWKSDPWHLPGPPYEVQLWVKEGYKEHRIRTKEKEQYREILEALSQACGK